MTHTYRSENADVDVVALGIVSGAGDQTIMDIAGYVSRQMLARYSNIRTEAKRSALEEVLQRRQKAGAAKLEEAAKQDAACGPRCS